MLTPTSDVPPPAAVASSLSHSWLQRLSSDAFTTICDYCDAEALTNVGYTSKRYARHLSMSRGFLPGRYPWNLRLQRAMTSRFEAPRRLVARLAVANQWEGWSPGLDPSQQQALQLATSSSLLSPGDALDLFDTRHAVAYFEGSPKDAIEHRMLDADDKWNEAPSSVTAALVAKLRWQHWRRLRVAMRVHGDVAAAPTVRATDDAAVAHAPEGEPGWEAYPSDDQPITADGGPTEPREAQRFLTRARRLLYPASTQHFSAAELDAMAFMIAHAVITRHQVHECDDFHKRALVARITGPHGGTVEVRFFAMLRHGSFPCFRAFIIWMPGDWKGGDMLNERFAAEATGPAQLFAAGFGRVEMDINPKLGADEMDRLMRCLRLPASYPFELMWNVLSVAVLGDAFDEHHPAFEFQYRKTVLESVARGFVRRGEEPKVPPPPPPAAETAADDAHNRSSSASAVTDDDTPPSVSDDDDDDDDTIEAEEDSLHVDDWAV